MSRPNVKCKGVHVKLDKETHTSFKTRLVHHGVTMQDAFEEFARLVGAGNLSANNLIERMVKDRVREELASVGLERRFARKTRYASELDQNMLYDLISEESTSGSNEPPRGGGNHEAA